MKNSKSVLAAGFLAATLMVPALALAQSSDQPERQRAATPHAASARASADAAVVTDSLAVLPINIDLRGILIGGEPAQLGAYVARVTFDHRKVAFVSVAGGSNARFAEAPTATNAAKANEAGELRVVGDQAGATSATGLVNVAALQFRELIAGGASSIRIQLLNATSALQRGDAGTVDNFKLPVEVAE